MKYRKPITVFSISILILISSSFNSYAASTWGICFPAKTTTTGPYIRVQLINCSRPDPSGGKDGWMTLSSDEASAKRFLISTAMSQEKNISIQYDGSQDTDGFNLITSVGLIGNN